MIGVLSSIVTKDDTMSVEVGKFLVRNGLVDLLISIMY